ncbi:hypothetical protein ACOME3_003744 [Neoechinorhynchus agilis]
MIYLELIAVSFSIFTSIVLAEPTFDISDCGDENAAVHFENVQLSPIPVPVPGGVYLNGTVHVSRELNGKMNIETTQFRRAMIVSFLSLLNGPYIPCIENQYGSCTYKDICRLAPAPCPTGFEEAHVPCHCPIPIGDYNVPTFFKEISIAMAPVLYGDFKVEAYLVQEKEDHTYKQTNRTLGCARFVVSVGK